MDRSQKEQLVAELSEAFADSSILIVTKQSGLTVAETEDLRGKVRGAEATFRVAKNRLVKLAIAGTDNEPLGEHLSSTTAIAYAAEPVAVAKALSDFAKDNSKLEILGGVLDGQVLDAAGVDALAKLPSLDQLRGQLAGLLNAPASKVARVVNAPASQLARVFAAYAEKDAA